MNRELLLKVRDHILEEPRRCDMGDWIVRSAEAPCGTVACVAGWACILSGDAFDRDRDDDVEHCAAKLLGLDHWSAEELFYLDDWPEELWDELKHYEPRSKPYAEIVALRINQFLLEHPE